MEITFLGMNAIRMTGKDIAVLADPYPKSAGLGDIKHSNDVTLLTLPQDPALRGDLPAPELPSKPGMVIDGPGEYEVKGAMITGVPARLHVDSAEDGNRAAIYSVAFDGIRVGYLGNVSGELSNAQIDNLGPIDVLIVPVGGKGLTLDAAGASQVISQLEPKYVIPTHYDDGKTKYEVPQDKLDTFLKETGSNGLEPQPKLRVSTKDLPIETTVVVLQPPSAL